MGWGRGGGIGSTSGKQGKWVGGGAGIPAMGNSTFKESWKRTVGLREQMLSYSLLQVSKLLVLLQVLTHKTDDLEGF